MMLADITNNVIEDELPDKLPYAKVCKLCIDQMTNVKGHPEKVIEPFKTDSHQAILSHMEHKHRKELEEFFGDIQVFEKVKHKPKPETLMTESGS